MNRNKRKAVGALAVLPAIGLGLTACGSTHTVTVPGPVKTVTVKVPVPGETRIVTKTVKVPGPVRTVTVKVPAPPPAPGEVIDTFRGTGNQTTPAFNVPDDGSYTVRWTYSGNVDSSFGSSSPTNFAIEETGSGEALGLPNDIASSGQGSTTITDADATDRLNVEGAGSWSITIQAA